MYRISAISSEYNLLSNLLIELIKEEFEIKDEEINLNKQEFKMDFFHQSNINTDTVHKTIDSYEYEINITHNAIHFWNDTELPEEEIKKLLKRFLNMNIFSRYGIEKTTKLKKEDNYCFDFLNKITDNQNLLDGKIGIAIKKTLLEDNTLEYNYLSGMRFQGVDIISYKEINTIENIKNSKEYFDHFIENAPGMINEK